MESRTEQQNIMLSLSLLSVLYGGFILFFLWVTVLLFSNAKWRHSRRSDPQLHLYYVEHFLVRQKEKAEAHCRTAVLREASDVPQMLARATTSMPAMPAPRHPNNAFTLELPPGSNYSRPRMQLLVKNLGYSWIFSKLQWKEDFKQLKHPNLQDLGNVNTNQSKSLEIKLCNRKRIIC